MISYIRELTDFISSSSIFTICLASTVFILVCWHTLLERHKYPSGPLPLPIIGNNYTFFSHARDVYRYKHWAGYGSVVAFVNFGSWMVQLFGYDAIHEAFIKNADYCSIRDDVTSVMPAVGLAFSDRWKDLRRHVLTVLKDHGMGKSKIEGRIREEMEYNLELLSNLGGKQNSEVFAKTMRKAVSNILSQALLGRRLDYTDSRFEALINFDPYFIKKRLSMLLPLYKYWPWDPLKLDLYTKYYSEVMSLITSEVKQHKATLDIDDPKDYIDSFLAEGIKSGDEPFTNDEEMASTVLHLFLGGSDTTTTTLTWFVLFLVNHPSAQQRIYEEIVQVVGSRSVSLADRDSMHFTHSFIHEVLRVGATTPSSLAHSCTQDFVVQGHTIPKGTTIFANLYSTYHDESIFPDSYSFIPGRFLDDQGKFSRLSGKQMFAFSMGKRACPGESLARTELFMILVTFVQRFEVSRLTEEKLREDGIEVFTHSPHPFEFYFKHRQ